MRKEFQIVILSDTKEADNLTEIVTSLFPYINNIYRCRMRKSKFA